MDIERVQALLKRVKRQERDAVIELYTYIVPIFYLQLQAKGMESEDASDVAREAAFKLISNIESYDPSKDKGG